MDDDKVIHLIPKLQLKHESVEREARASDILRTLARAIREMRERGATSASIARVLRQAADDLDGDDRPA